MGRGMGIWGEGQGRRERDGDRGMEMGTRGEGWRHEERDGEYRERDGAPGSGSGRRAAGRGPSPGDPEPRLPSVPGKEAPGPGCR